MVFFKLKFLFDLDFEFYDNFKGNSLHFSRAVLNHLQIATCSTQTVNQNTHVAAGTLQSSR